MLDIARGGRSQGRFRDQTARDAARIDEGDGHLAGGAAGRQRRRRAYQVRDHGPLPDRASELLGARARDHVARRSALAPLRLPRRRGGAEGPRLPARKARPADVIVYDYDRLDSGPQERLWDYPAGEMRLVQKATGYKHIIVNGVTTFVDGECTDATPGDLLRHGSD